MEPQDSLAAIVRSADPDRYLSALYAPAEARDALLAVYAFDAEVAGIRDRVREPLPGEIRLQWWRDTLAAAAPVGHPLADALVTAVRQYDLPFALFDAMLEARIFDIYDDPMASRADLETYLGETEGATIRLASLVLASGKMSRSDDAIFFHAGCARGLARMLLRLPSDRARGRCFVPRDILAAVGGSPEVLLGNALDASRSRAVQAMLALTREHLDHFLASAADLPAAVRPAFLPLAVVPDLLEALKTPESVLGGRVKPLLSWRRHWLMLKRATRGWPRR